MSSNKDFDIQFEGLKNGKHNFKFKITDTFFEGLAYSIIEGATADVKLVLEKKETMLIGQFEIEGIVRKACDRCTDTMEIPITVEHQIIYKFGDEESIDENLITVPRSAFSINVASEIYELLTVSLPTRSVHEEGECNEEMLQLIEKYVNSSDTDADDESSDPRWDALRNMN